MNNLKELSFEEMLEVEGINFNSPTMDNGSIL
jgi:hypothetical protein